MTDRDQKGDEMSDRLSRRFGESESEESSEGEQTSEEDKSSKRENTSKTSQSTEREQTSQPSQASKEDKASKRENTSKESKREQEPKTEKITERRSVLMYLPDDQHNELDYRFDELNLKHKREFGEALEKNRDYYPAVIEAALNEEKTLEEILLNSEK